MKQYRSLSVFIKWGAICVITYYSCQTIMYIVDRVYLTPIVK